MISPPSLRTGDTVAIVSPGKAIEPQHIDFARVFFESKGYKVITGDHAYGQHNYFSGTDEQRMADLQFAIDHPDVKAIICARGGYGCIRLTSKLSWANILREPRWLVGFSDVTVLHFQAQKLGLESLHATMPLNYEENSDEALSTMMRALTGESRTIGWEPAVHNKAGFAEGELVGGNLSIIYSLLATPLRPDFSDRILFIEDLSEQVYHVDRMFHTLKLNGVLDEVAGIVIGGMTEMRETAVPTAWKIEELLLEQLAYRNIPVAFHAPVGHIADNRALVCGRKASLSVEADKVSLFQL
jgi:muramoyltetrapeptide carboxypeptidase